MDFPVLEGFLILAIPRLASGNLQRQVKFIVADWPRMQSDLQTAVVRPMRTGTNFAVESSALRPLIPPFALNRIQSETN
ncbi:MAG TPA: hypothetical protein VI454_16280 [Verrucomicrobiae bacterium]|jgi:hypothetical protein